MPRHRFTCFWLCCLLMFTMPTAALADAGTPLMWTGIFHLFILNLLIGLLEAWVICRWFPQCGRFAKLSMIAANYFSATVGALTLSHLWQPVQRMLHGSSPMQTAGATLAILVALSWLMSVLLEWPFIALSLQRGQRTPARSLRASVAAQTASYALLIPLYMLVSPISLVTSGHVQRDLSFVKASTAQVYYIVPHAGGRGSIWRASVDGTGKVKLMDVSGVDQYAQLFTVRSDASKPFDLYLTGPDFSSNQLLIKNVGSDCAAFPHHFDISSQTNVWMNVGSPADFRPESQRQWTVYTGFWATEGITTEHNGHLVSTLAFDTPFTSWYPRSATILPSDQVVFQIGPFGDSQIAVMDMHTQKIGVIAMGQGPVVVLGAAGAQATAA